MSNKLKATKHKGINPEAKLQESVERDIKIRHLEEHAKHQADSLAVARWEAALVIKDRQSVKKQFEDKAESMNKIANESLKSTRRQRLINLYKNDELRYESELSSLGLSFIRERL
eukprot:gene5938-8186_t